MRWEVQSDGIAEMLSSDQARQWLETVAAMVLARAVIYTGVDMGHLRSSMSWRIEHDALDGVFHAILGSGTADHLNSVFYALYHWTGDASLLFAPDGQAARRKGAPPNTQTKDTPTRAWTRALTDLGLAPTFPQGVQA